jgi:hypothetical protein
MSDLDPVDRITDKILDALTSLDDEDKEHVLDAIKNAIVVWMAGQYCAHHRKNVAREFKRDIPDMLTEANKMAAIWAAEKGRPNDNCH